MIIINICVRELKFNSVKRYGSLSLSLSLSLYIYIYIYIYIVGYSLYIEPLINENWKHDVDFKSQNGLT